jgi:hypothetical protein
LSKFDKNLDANLEENLYFLLDENLEENRIPVGFEFPSLFIKSLLDFNKNLDDNPDGNNTGGQ